MTSTRSTRASLTAAKPNAAAITALGSSKDFIAKSLAPATNPLKQQPAGHPNLANPGEIGVSVSKTTRRSIQTPETPRPILVNMKVISLGAAILLALAPPLTAQDYVILDQRADEFDRWQERVDWTYGRPVIVREFDVAEDVVEEQRTRTGLGYGGLMIANALARETGRSFDDIVAMKQSGMGWGRIAQENGVKLGPIVSRLNRADRSFRTVKVKSNNGNGNGNGRGKFKAAKVSGGKAHGHGGGNGKGHGRGGGGKGKGKGGGKGKK